MILPGGGGVGRLKKSMSEALVLWETNVEGGIATFIYYSLAFSSYSSSLSPALSSSCTPLYILSTWVIATKFTIIFRCTDIDNYRHDCSFMKSSAGL